MISNSGAPLMCPTISSSGNPINGGNIIARSPKRSMHWVMTIPPVQPARLLNEVISAACATLTPSALRAVGHQLRSVVSVNPLQKYASQNSSVVRHQPCENSSARAVVAAGASDAIVNRVSAAKAAGAKRAAIFPICGESGRCVSRKRRDSGMKKARPTHTSRGESPPMMNMIGQPCVVTRKAATTPANMLPSVVPR